MKPWIHIIRPENYEDLVMSGKVPFLLLCMPHNKAFSKQLEVIEAIAEKYQDALKVGVLAEESIELFKKNLSIIGSPTFLLLAEGKEENRILGIIDEKSLIDIIDKYLSANR